ncbi:MAG: hypothetical protein JXO72_07845 [Vicinamibacteria bacterium]|nr:hypothetical protein [Vicinamibacteria bacterium]
MIIGLNRVFEHGGKQYHLQIEDMGLENAGFEVRVYEGGTVLLNKRVSYEELLAQGLPREEQEQKLRSLMDKALHTVEAAISRGRFQ